MQEWSPPPPPSPPPHVPPLLPPLLPPLTPTPLFSPPCAPQERSPIDFPQEWITPQPSRRPDIFPEFEKLQTPMPKPMPGDPEVRQQLCAAVEPSGAVLWSTRCSTWSCATAAAAAAAESDAGGPGCKQPHRACNCAVHWQLGMRCCCA